MSEHLNKSIKLTKKKKQHYNLALVQQIGVGIILNETETIAWSLYAQPGGLKYAEKARTKRTLTHSHVLYDLILICVYIFIESDFPNRSADVWAINALAVRFSVSTTPSPLRTGFAEEGPRGMLGSTGLTT